MWLAMLGIDVVAFALMAAGLAMSVTPLIVLGGAVFFLSGAAVVVSLIRRA
jgi:hypothetical protein